MEHHFPRNLKALRILQDRSQNEMADILGVKRSTYSAWENGASQPNLEHLCRIQHHHQIGIDVMLGASLYAYHPEEIHRLRITMAPRPRVGQHIA